MLKRIALGAVLLIALAFLAVWGAGQGWLGELETPGTVHATPRTVARSEAETRAQREGAHALGVESAKQILFGDLHVHTTFSFDAFLLSLPRWPAARARTRRPTPATSRASARRSISGRSTTTPRDSLRATGARRSTRSASATRSAGDGRGARTRSRSSAGSGRRSAPRPRTTTATRTWSCAARATTQIPARPIAAGGRALQLREGAAPGVVARGLAALGGGSPRYHDLARYFAGAPTSARLSRRRPRARAAARLPRGGGDAGQPVREARRLGLRLDRDPARHDLGLLHARRARAGTSSSSAPMHDERARR